MKNREKEIYRVTITGSVVNALLVVLKLLAGVFGRSSALVADAVHSLTDFITDIIVLFFVRISGKPSDAEHGYGHGKFETLATMIIGVVLMLTGMALFVNGVGLIVVCLDGKALSPPEGIALIVAVVSIAAKELLYHYTVRRGKALKSDAVVANAWHHRSDAISSIGTVVGVSGAMFLGDRWRILDPLAAVLVSFFIIKAGYDIIHPAVNELLESSLPEKQTARLKKIISSVEGVRGYHRLRTRKVGNVIAVDVHIKMDGSMSLSEAHDIASVVEREIKREYGFASIVNVHMEPYNHKDADNKN